MATGYGTTPAAAAPGRRRVRSLAGAHVPALLYRISQPVTTSPSRPCMVDVRPAVERVAAVDLSGPAPPRIWAARVQPAADQVLGRDQVLAGAAIQRGGGGELVGAEAIVAVTAVEQPHRGPAVGDDLVAAHAAVRGRRGTRGRVDHRAQRDDVVVAVPADHARRADRRDRVVALVAVDVRAPAEVRMHGDRVVAVAAVDVGPVLRQVRDRVVADAAVDRDRAAAELEGAGRVVLVGEVDPHVLAAACGQRAAPLVRRDRDAARPGADDGAPDR